MTSPEKDITDPQVDDSEGKNNLPSVQKTLKEDPADDATLPDDTDITQIVLPSIQYSREEMLLLEKSDFSLLRPTYLDIQFDRDGRWDPMAWHAGKPSSELESVPVGTLEFRKRTRSNAGDSAKEVEVVLSPQRMSFTGGCAGTKFPTCTTAAPSTVDTRRTNGIKSKYDKSDSRIRDPEREKHLQKVNGSYSGNREQIRKAIRDLHENRDRQKELKDDGDEGWTRNGDFSKPSHSEYSKPFTKEPKYNSCNGSSSQGKRPYSSRRISEKSVDDVPEWFADGPTSRLDTIELKGFEDDDNTDHSIEATDTKSEVRSRETELAMDPLGNPDMALNQYANDSIYSTGLQENWDPTNAKFNVDALLDPDAFLEEGKDLLEVEKSMTMGSNKSLMEFWGKEGTTQQPRPNSSPGVIPTGKSPGANATVPFSTSEVHFGDNSATSSLKAMLGVNFGDLTKMQGVPGNIPMMAGPPPLPNGVRPPLNLEDPFIRQLLTKEKQSPIHPNIKPPSNDIPLSPALLQQVNNLPPNIREMLIQRSQSEQFPPANTAGMLPHPGHLFPTRPNESLFRDPRLVDPRLIDPRIAKPEHLNLISPQTVKPVPKASQDLLKSVKNDPVQLDKVINHLQTQLKIGRAPPEAAPAMAALLRDLEKAKVENIKQQTLQMLTSGNLNPQHFKPPEQVLHDKTQALKALLRLPGQQNPLMTAPARIAPIPPPHPPHSRPRVPHEEAIPTRITSHDHRNMIPGSRAGFPMTFTPTSVMIKSQEFRNLMRHASEDGLIRPTHPPNLQTVRSMGPPPTGNKSPRFDDEPRPVPTIESSRPAMPKIHFPNTSLPPPNFSPHHGMKTSIPPFLLQQQIPPPNPANPKLPPHGKVNGFR